MGLRNNLLTTALLSGAIITNLSTTFSFADESSDTKTSSLARVSTGLQLLYDFNASDGNLIKDRSGIGEPLDLEITEPDDVKRENGTLQILDNTVVKSINPPARLLQSVQWTNEITIEAWIKPANTEQDGPARIITFSENGSNRNFTLGQDGDQYDVRFRTTTTSNNGIPSTSSDDDAVTTELTHVVYTRDRNGHTRIFINGELSEDDKVAGLTSNWSPSYHLGLSNELSGDRPWLGTYDLVAIYNRDLLPHEIQQNYNAGPNPQNMGTLAQAGQEQNHIFDTEIAPILVQHCLECHDPNTKDGGLDLSRKKMAFAGGKGGPAIVPGKADESPLWQLVEYDVMPYDRPPMSDEEKQTLKQWINNGAEWTKETIDPAAFAHGSGGHENWVRRLTVPEYIATVKAAVGVDIEKEARELLPPDLRADGFSNTAYNLNVDLKHVESYAQLAQIIVERMDVVEFAEPYADNKRLTDDNMRELIANMGNWILRGPLEEKEINLYRGISTTVASAGGDYKEAVSYIIEAMLQSPKFMYRMVDQRGDGSRWPVSDYELASRLSYSLWGAPPDKELMRLVDDGKLYGKKAVAEQVDRMLKDPRAIDKSQRFISGWLNLGGLKNLRPNKEKFPAWKPVLADDMREETIKFFTYLAWQQKRPLIDLFNAQIAYLTPRLAKHYGLVAKDVPEESPQKFERYDVSTNPTRGGLLTHGSVLTKGGDEASMVSRGLFVLHDVLRGSVNDPPPCVDTSPVPTKPGLTQRGIAEDRIADPACGGCHSKFEPLAFGLEKFDGLGTFHQVDEHGNKLREDGNILFPGEEDQVEYDTSKELMNILANHERVNKTITYKLTQFILGRPLVQDDTKYIEEIHKTAQKNGGTYQSLIKAIVMSDLVLTTKTEAYNDKISYRQ